MHCYQGPEPCWKCNDYNNRWNEKNVFSLNQASWNYDIANGVIICCNKKQVAKFYSHGFGDGKWITAKNKYPRKVNTNPKESVIYEGFTFQNALYIQS